MLAAVYAFLRRKARTNAHTDTQWEYAPSVRENFLQEVLKERTDDATTLICGGYDVTKVSVGSINANSLNHRYLDATMWIECRYASDIIQDIDISVFWIKCHYSIKYHLIFLHHVSLCKYF